MAQTQTPFNRVVNLSVQNTLLQIVPPNIRIGSFKVTAMTPTGVVAISPGISADPIPFNLSDGMQFPDPWKDGFYVTNPAQGAGFTATISFQPAPASAE